MKQAFLFALVCFLFLEKATAQTNPFEREIAAFEAKDSANKPIAGQIVLYGNVTHEARRICNLGETSETIFR